MGECWAITGGTGYVGSLLAKRLASRGDLIRLLTRKTDVTLPATVIRGDLAAASALEELVDGADVVVHLAGFVHRPVRTHEERAECFEVNVSGTENLVNAVLRNAPNAFVIAISTSNVYGFHRIAARESDAIAPETPYGTSKMQAENVVRASGLRATIVRPAMVLGPGAPGNFHRLVRFVQYGIVPRIGPSPPKSLVPVDDLLDSLLLMASMQQQAAGETFNVGSSGEVLTISEIVEVICEEFGLEACVLPVPVIPALFAARAIDELLSVMNPRMPSLRQMVETFSQPAVLDDSKIRERLGFVGTAGVNVTIRKTVQAYKQGAAIR